MNTPVIPFNMQRTRAPAPERKHSPAAELCKMLEQLKCIFTIEWHPSSEKPFTNFTDQAVHFRGGI